VGPALAFLVPRVIGMLTPDRIVPSDLPAEVSAWLSGPAPKPGRPGAGPIDGQRAETRCIPGYGDVVEQAIQRLTAATKLQQPPRVGVAVAVSVAARAVQAELADSAAVVHTINSKIQ
jgi:hypothetical protein